MTEEDPGVGQLVASRQAVAASQACASILPHGRNIWGGEDQEPQGTAGHRRRELDGTYHTLGVTTEKRSS